MTQAERLKAEGDAALAESDANDTCSMLPKVGGDTGYWMRTITPRPAEALPETLRRLIDLEQMLRAVPPDAEDRNDQRWKLLWNTAVDASGLPSGRAEALRMRDAAYPGDPLDELQLQPKLSPELELAYPSGSGRLRCGALRRFDAEQRPSGGKDEPLPLPDELNTLTWVLHDHVLGRSSGVTASTNRFVKTGGCDIECALVAHELSGSFAGHEGMVELWPLPDGLRVADYLLLGSHWRTNLDRVRNGSTIANNDDRAGELAQRFIDTVCSLASHGSYSPPDRPPTWQDLARKVIALLNLPTGADATRRAPLATWARTAAALLAAPESGLTAAAANEWLDAWQGAILEAKLDREAFSPLALNSVRSLRRRRIRTVVSGRAAPPDASHQESAKGVGEALRLLDADQPEYRWSSRMAIWESDWPLLFTRITCGSPAPLAVTALDTYLDAATLGAQNPSELQSEVYKGLQDIELSRDRLRAFADKPGLAGLALGVHLERHRERGATASKPRVDGAGDATVGKIHHVCRRTGDYWRRPGVGTETEATQAVEYRDRKRDEGLATDGVGPGGQPRLLSVFLDRCSRSLASRSRRRTFPRVALAALGTSVVAGGTRCGHRRRGCQRYGSTSSIAAALRIPTVFTRVSGRKRSVSPLRVAHATLAGFCRLRTAIGTVAATRSADRRRAR
jgi:hypothetical protein